MFRTYNVNVIARAKYHLVLNTDLDQGITVDVALERKRESREETKLQQYGRWYLYAAGFSLLMAIIDG